MAIDEEAVLARVASARLRSSELLGLNGGDLAGADAHERQRLAQEVFFHLGGAIEFMAQLAGERRGVGSADTISASNISDRLRADPLEASLRNLYVSLRKAPFPNDPYDDEGYLWRIYNYRHQVTHRGANPFNFQVFLGDAALSTAAAPTPRDRSAHLLLDPLDPGRGPSRETIRDDLNEMLDLVETRINAAIAAL
jgi:hypothetical protein